MNLESNELTTRGLRALADMLRKNSTITTLKLQNQVGVDVDAELALLDALRHNTTLTCLGYHFRKQGHKEECDQLTSRNMDKARLDRVRRKKNSSLDSLPGPLK